MDKRSLAPCDPAEQEACCELVRRAHLGQDYQYYIHTFGCQMNVHDSQKLAAYLELMGYTPAPSAQDADLILFNTCCVREGAETRVYGQVGSLKALKSQKPGMLVCVCGCMMQQEGAAQKLRSTFPFVDILFGTNELTHFPQMVYEAISGKKRAVYLGSAESVPEGVPIKREDGISAYTTIMYGCNNFCSYCIVPYVRGRERSRHVADIEAELRELKEKGVQEVMLLGQNVNSYGKDLAGPTFSGILTLASNIGIPRIRFMTSHPKDLSDDVLHAMADLPGVAHQLHLPVQSGSDRILAAMNRRYDRAHYLGIIEKARKLMPDIGITTDIIAGFPGETDEDFEATLDLVKTVGYDNAFTFIYSPRKGTKAAAMPEQVPQNIKSARLQRLIALQEEESSKICAGLVGSEQSLLVTGRDKKTGRFTGRIERGTVTSVASEADLTGKFVNVRIVSAGRSSLDAELV